MLKRFYFILLHFFTFNIVLLCSVLLHAQNTYVKTVGNFYGDFGTSCKQTPDKGTILTLETTTNGMNMHIGLVKADYNGTFQWSRLFQVGNWCVPQSVLPTPDSGYLVFGTAADSFVINGSHNFLFLLKADSSGDEQWLKKYPVSSNDLAVNAIRCRSGGYLACSVADYNSGLNPRAVLTRFDDTGNVIWTRQYSAPFGIQVRGIVELSNGNICIASCTGSFSSTPFTDVLVTQTDSTGNLQWSKTFSTYYDDEANAITSNASGEIFITGRSYFIGREWDGFLLKLDANGNKLLSKFYDAGTQNGEIMRCILARDDGSCTLLGDVGTFDERDIALLDIRVNGDLNWVRRFSFSPLFTNYPYEMYTAYDGGFVFTGDVRWPSYGRDAALVKTDRNGNVSCFNSTLNFTLFPDTFQVTDVTLTHVSSMIPIQTDTSVIPWNNIIQRIICENPIPVPDFSFVPDTVCPDVCFAFTDLSLNQPTTWLWEFPGADPPVSNMQHPFAVCYHQPGDYPVKLSVTNNFGTSVINGMIHLRYYCPEKEEPFYIPNVFTPNNDNFNDEFSIRGLPDEFLLRIFNRWGQELFHSSDKSISWRGKTKNNIEVPDGVYFYELLLGDKKLNGMVQLIR